MYQHELMYFDGCKVITIQVDASKKDLKVPSCKMAVNWISHVFGYHLAITSNHKPLEQIKLKNLANVPAHLHWMSLCLHCYDVNIKCLMGKEMLIGDALSD